MDTDLKQQTTSDTIQIGGMQDNEATAVGNNATAVTVKTFGDVGDVVTGTKISLVNQETTQRVASKQQVSAPPDDYIERPQVEQKLKDLLLEKNGGFRIIYLYGLPGTGKSWVARKVAKDLEDIFTDGILWADLQRNTIRTAVWNFIEPYDEKISRHSLTSPNEYKASMIKAFGDQRILIVFDQVNDWYELQDWQPDECDNCVVLLISQQAPPDLRENKSKSSYHLTGMTSDEALQMFEHLLARTKGSQAYNSSVLRELAERLDYMPIAINSVARDITIKLESPEDYLKKLSTGNQDNSSSEFLSGLETIFQNLPKEGQALLPFLGIIRNVPWTADGLQAISLINSHNIKVGLKQLEHAGLVKKQPTGYYQTPNAIIDFAIQKLKDDSNEQFINATMMLRASDILRKSNMILRYLQQSLIAEYWANEAPYNEEKHNDQLVKSFENLFYKSAPNTKDKSQEINLLLTSIDPLEDFFEDVILTQEAYANRWLNLLQNTQFLVIRNQLEAIFDWAMDREDWSLIRQFTRNIGTNTIWMVDKKYNGSEDNYDWLSLRYNFILLKKMESHFYEFSDVILKAPRIEQTTWEHCQFLATKWPGAQIKSSTFNDIDMVGIEMPGSFIIGCEFANLDARYADFRGAIFQQCSFSNVKFHGAKFENAKFIACSFINVDFRMTILEEDYKNKS